MKPDRSLLILAAACALSGCVRTLTLSQDDALTVVPYDLQDSGRILVDVRLNDRGPLPFALDTAASTSFVFDAYRGALESVSGVTTRVHGAVATGRFPTVRVERLRVGGEIWLDAELVALPGDTDATVTLAGILGIDFLRRYGVGFSAQDRVLRLYAPDLIGNRTYRGWASLPLVPIRIGESREPLYFFEIEVGGRRVPALFDLGAGLNLMNPLAARVLGLAARRAEDGELFSGALASAPILAQLAEDVETAGIHWRNEVFLIADLDIFATLLFEDRPLAIVGAGLFNQRDFVIDFLRNRLLIRVTMDEIE